MTTQTFSVVGITEHNGNSKVRFTDDMVRRVKQFSKGGATRCEFISLPESMTKLDALRFLKEQNLSGDAGYAVDAKLAEKMREARKGEVRVGFDLAEIRARKQDAVPA